jgi:oxaloacetate decarboxylase alpha subunit
VLDYPGKGNPGREKDEMSKATNLKKIEFVDETFRDAPQSVWATRMRTESMLGIAPMLDEAGVKQACVSSAAAFETAVMYLYEDPWERIRLLKKSMPKTPLSVLIRGRNIFGWRRYSNDVIELLLKCLFKAGIQWIMVFDGLNDLRNLEWHIRAGKRIGLKVIGEEVFTESPVHTDDYFAGKAKEFIKLGVDGVILEDASGVLRPERTHTLVPAIRQAVGHHELQFHSHCSTGSGPECYWEALKQGADTLCTASLPMAYGESLPATIDVLRKAREMGFDDRMDEQQIKRIDDYCYWVAYKEQKPLGQPIVFDPSEFQKYVSHQIPGGMMSNLVKQLSDLGLLHRLPEVLEEAGRVRQEIGYPVMVTPFSQLVGVQATLNIVEGKRYQTVPQELRLYARGFYGAPATPFDQNVLDLLLGDEKPIDPTASFDEPFLEKYRAEYGPFRSDEDMLLTLFNARSTMEKFYKNKKKIEIPVVESPLVAFIKELASKNYIQSIQIEKGSLRLKQSF